MKRNLLLALLFLSVTHALSACATSLMYTAESMEARIVDADTKEPLEGVIVVAHWELERGTVGGNVPAGQLRVMEAVTDKEGKFSFPGFGPETLWDSFLVNKDPELLFFKSGYEYQRLYNEYNSTRELRTRKVRRSDWDGKTIALKPFKGTGEGYASHLSFMHTSIRSILDDCNWKKIPRMLLALRKQKDIFKKQNVRHSLYAADYVPTNEKECGSPEEFFRSYRP